MATAYWTPEDWECDTVSKKMATPKRASSLQHWVREARKVIVDIPLLEAGYGTAAVNYDTDNIKISWPGIGYLHIDRSTRKAV